MEWDESPCPPPALGRITTSGRQRQSRPVPIRGVRYLGAWALLAVLHGHGHFRDDRGVDASIRAGDLLLLFPAIGHAYGPDAGTEWVERYVVFDGPICGVWEAARLLDPARPVRCLHDINQWNDRVDRILAAHRPNRQLALLGVLLADLEDDEDPGSALARTDDARWLARAQTLLALDPGGTDRLPLAAIADDLAMTYDGFRKRFRRLTGTSPARYRAERTIAHAQDLIATGFLTDREIAERLGFVDEHHFSRRFRQLVGRSPRAWRDERARR